jgi:anti-anti-sigma factor
MSIELMLEQQQSELLLSGELSIYDVKALKDALSQALAASPLVEVDLSGVDDLDSAVLQTLVAAKLQADRDGRTLRLTGHGEVGRHTLELTGLSAFFGDPELPPSTAPQPSQASQQMRP